jgi:hypothetical protein
VEAVRCCASNPAENLTDQRDSVVGDDDDGDGQRHCGVQPVPASGRQDDPACRGHTRCRGGIGECVEQDRCDRQVPLLGLILTVICVSGVDLHRNRIAR